MRAFARTYRILGVILIIATLMMSCFSAANAQDTGVTATVSAGIISLQSGPGLDFSSLGTAKLNQKFPVIGRARGSKRVWYEIVLPTGGNAWVSERVVNIDPSPDSLPWLGDNTAKTPLVMDCGRFRPLMFVGAYAQIINPKGLALTKEPGIGKRKVGEVAVNTAVKVLDGPFCTLLSTDRYQVEWLVLDHTGVSGYLLEGLPNGQGPYIKLATGVSDSDFPASAQQNQSDPSNTDRPANITDDDIAKVVTIFDGVQHKTINEKEAERQLNALLNGRDPSMLAWIVRRVPIYDGKARGWVSLSRYEDLTLMTFKGNSDLDQDPIKTTLAILFGSYKDETQEFQAIGCGG